MFHYNIVEHFLSLSFIVTIYIFVSLQYCGTLPKSKFHCNHLHICVSTILQLKVFYANRKKFCKKFKILQYVVNYLFKCETNLPTNITVRYKKLWIGRRLFLCMWCCYKAFKILSLVAWLVEFVTEIPCLLGHCIRKAYWFFSIAFQQDDWFNLTFNYS